MRTRCFENCLCGDVKHNHVLSVAMLVWGWGQDKIDLQLVIVTFSAVIRLFTQITYNFLKRKKLKGQQLLSVNRVNNNSNNNSNNNNNTNPQTTTSFGKSPYL